MNFPQTNSPEVGWPALTGLLSAVTEFLEGFTRVDDGESLLAAYAWLDVTGRVAREAAVLRRRLRLEGRLMGHPWSCRSGSVSI